MHKPPYLILYDSSNVDVVLNHICNLRFIPNTLSRLVAIAFDENAELALRQKHPMIPNVLIDLKPLVDYLDPGMQNRGYLIYTLALVVHAKICASLALRGIDFWSMHQDTLWTQNFDLMNVEDRYPDSNLLFDTIGNEVESYMLSYQSPDSSIMTYLCGHHHYKCQFLPQWMVSSYNYFEGPRENVPILIQLDGGKRPGESKMDVMRRGRFVFRHDNGTCDERTFYKLREYVKFGFPDAIRKDGSLKENLYSKTLYVLKNLFNIDPGNRKFYLTIHQSLI
uniref:Nucleotid_trans domain-containing protein n=1 Tax=Caenorhabditis tropicalis TaxID=1561998 RepID=A0A1I7UTZ7_9PELO